MCTVPNGITSVKRGSVTDIEPRSLRARGVARREAVLRAATEVFLESGYEGAAMSEIVARAGGSKTFIYEQFGSKAGLFRAMMADSCAAILRPLADDALKAGDPREALTVFARRFVDVICEPQALALQRVATSEGPRNPEVAEAYFTSGHDVAYARLATYLAGVARTPMPEGHLAVLVTTFLAMIRGQRVERLAVGSTAVPPPSETEAILGMSVDWLLGRIGLA